MTKKSSLNNLSREMVFGANYQGYKVKGAFEYICERVGLMPKRVEPRKNRPLWYEVFFILLNNKGGK
jgi:hypothetical protein